ncbi:MULTISPECIES: MFS transporter [Metallosphaera]|uniref:MFS transporter n=1 Tax=Metallosphaera TaxID=41980 RepID=UPI001F07069B|nr:MFS transporter [Metallosphaera sedula]MCH1771071.1 MFS transporter [Metallosphaera sedula]MCP6729441.1 MFS transporter [Metallosphaera sedula]
MNSDVYKISFSAFFADLGYQAVVASFPIILVFQFHLPIYIYGVVESVSYGVGLIFSFLGGALADRYGSKRVAIFGNLLVTLLSFTGLAQNSLEAIGLFLSGWFMRNFRSPARRTMLVQATSENERSRAFAILHSLDFLGGLIAVVYLSVGLYLKFSFAEILPLTAVPILISSLFLYLSRPREGKSTARRSGKVLGAVALASLLFGISTYSPGFPIITVTQSTSQIYLGTLTYGFFLGSSSGFGMLLSRLRMKDYLGLTLGYLVTAIASAGFIFLFPFREIGLYPMAILLGVGSAFAETFEPSIVSKVAGQNVGTGMGILSLSRGIGYFVGNSVMGLLYSLSYVYAYAFASLIALGSTVIILALVRK